MLQTAENGILDQQIQQIDEAIKTNQGLILPVLQKYLELFVLPSLKEAKPQDQKSTINTIIKTLQQDFQDAYLTQEIIDILNKKTVKTLETKIHPSESKLISQGDFESDFKKFHANIRQFHNQYELALNEFSLKQMQEACNQLEQFGWRFIQDARSEFTHLSELLDARTIIAKFKIFETNYISLISSCLNLSNDYNQQTQEVAFGLQALAFSMDWEHLKLEILSSGLDSESKSIDFFRKQLSIPSLSNIPPSFSQSSVQAGQSALLEALKKVKPLQKTVISASYEIFWADINEFLRGIQSLVFFDLRSMDKDCLHAISQLCVEFHHTCESLCKIAANELQRMRQELSQPQSGPSSEQLIYQYVPKVMALHLSSICLNKFLKNRWNLELDLLIKTNASLLKQNKALQEELFSLENLQKATQSIIAFFPGIQISAPRIQETSASPTDFEQKKLAITNVTESSISERAEENEDDDEEEEDEKDLMTLIREGNTSTQTLSMVTSNFIDPSTSHDSFFLELKNAGDEHLSQLELKISTAAIDQLIQYKSKVMQLQNFYENIHRQYNDTHTNSFAHINQPSLSALIENCKKLATVISKLIQNTPGNSTLLSSSQSAMFSSSSSSSSSSIASSSSASQSSSTSVSYTAG